VKVRQRESLPPVQQPSLGPVDSVPLARDPGLPPFALKEPPPQQRRRSPWAVLALGVVATLLFAAALAGGFAATRLIAGKSLLPKSSTTTTGTDDPAAELNLTTHVDKAKHTGTLSDGDFSISAPDDPWRLFHSERKDIATSLVVSFVSPDGNTEIAVQRYGGFFSAGHKMTDYSEQLPTFATGSQVEVSVGLDVADGAGKKRMKYTTTERSLLGSPGEDRRRSTAAELIRRGNDLWIVRVTVPADQAATAEPILNEIQPTLETQ
jgi:hypothetical protein